MIHFIDYPETIHIKLSTCGAIVLFVGDMLTLGKTISYNPDYAQWLISNRSQIQELFDSGFWFQDENDIRNDVPSRYKNELVANIEYLSKIVKQAEDSSIRYEYKDLSDDKDKYALAP